MLRVCDKNVSITFSLYSCLRVHYVDNSNINIGFVGNTQLPLLQKNRNKILNRYHYDNI